MEFRFTPRQKGLFGKRIRRAGGNAGDTYEPKDTVKESEIEKAKNSRVTPYQHRMTVYDAPEQSGAEDGFNSGLEERITRQSAGARDENAQIMQRGAVSAVLSDMEQPTKYIDEPTGDIWLLPQEIPKAAATPPDDIDNALGTDADGNILFKDDVIAYIKDELEKRRSERLPLELQWQLNSNFYDGNQYCDINPACDEIMQYPIAEGEEGKQREVFNRIAPLIETRVANLKKINYSMRVNPLTNETDDVQKARVSTAILNHAQQKSGFNAKKDALILWNEMCGSCFFTTWWDPEAGEITSAVRETMTDDDGRSASKLRFFHEGDIDYGLLTPYEVYPESIFKQTVADQQSIIVEQVRTVDEIEKLYGVRPEGTEIDTFTLTPIPAAGGYGYEATVVSMGKAKMKNCQTVVTYFERASKAFPRGRMAVLIGDEDLVYYGEMPYDEIPIIRCVCKERPGQFFGKSVIEELIPLQRAYNTACNDIGDYLKTVKTPQYLVYEGTVDVDEWEERAGIPGAILVYKGNPNVPPIPRPSTAFSGEVFTQKYDLERQMEYVAAVSQLMVYGETPQGVTSGTAIESLRDIDNTRLALTGDYIRASVIEMAKIWLSMYKRYASGWRVIRTVGTNDLGDVLVWSSEDITSYDVTFTTENELMYSDQNQWQRLLQLLTSGINDQRIIEEAVEKAREYIKSGAANSAATVNELQEQAAARENTMLERGVLPRVREYDNHRLHAEEHLKYMLQLEFERMQRDRPQIAEAMMAHYREHIQRLNYIAPQAAQER